MWSLRAALNDRSRHLTTIRHYSRSALLTELARASHSDCPVMRVIERSVYRGPHLYSATPMVRFMLDLQQLEEFPTNLLPGFTDRLLTALPSLDEHGCSLHRPGGLTERLRKGTWIGHVVEHIALELQSLAGSSVSRGKTRSVKGRPGVYNVMYAYADEAAGLAAGRLALEFVNGLLPQEHQGLAGLDRLSAHLEPAPRDEAVPGLSALARLVTTGALGPTTRALVDEARRRDIPHERLDQYSLIRFGHGSRQKLLRASITGATSQIAVETAGNKDLTKALLDAAGVPVPRGTLVQTAEEAVAAAARLRGPVVTKPLDGNHGRGVTVNLVGDDEVRRGFTLAAAHGRRVIVEEQLPGRDHRVLVVGGKVVAVAERVPARVVGTGLHTVAELIETLNSDPRRGRGHEKVLTRVRVDEHVIGMLAGQGLTVEDTPDVGHEVILRDTANLSTGAEAIDRTDDIHPDNAAMAERAARIVGLDIAGLDLLAPDITVPVRETGGGIIEVNAAPGFRMHLQPSEGQSRDVAGPVIEMLYPRGSRSRIPITSVTGTNGKSTTVRMISHILAHNGLTVGMTTTSGVYISGHLVKAVDASGPKSARMVLADPTVDAAVFETARGGILREGLAYDRADIGIVLNVSADHLGLKGIDTLAELAAVKSVVTEQVRRRGTSILNADDPLTLRMARHAGGRVLYFTAHGRADMRVELLKHLAAGGTVAAIEPSAQGGLLTLHEGATAIPLLKAAEIPATLAGEAAFNIQNALVAAAAAYSHGVSVAVIASALRGFESSFEQNPGRLNVTRAPGFTTILDYAHNPAALRAIGEVITNLRPRHDRVIGVVSIPGDRRDDDIREMGQIAALIFDELIFRERPDGRGRASGGVVGLLSEGAIAAGMPAGRVRRIMDEQEAMDMALRMAGPDDLVVMMPTEVEAVWEQVQAFRHRTDAGTRLERKRSSR